MSKIARSHGSKPSERDVFALCTLCCRKRRESLNADSVKSPEDEVKEKKESGNCTVQVNMASL